MASIVVGDIGLSVRKTSGESLECRNGQIFFYHEVFFYFVYSYVFGVLLNRFISPIPMVLSQRLTLETDRSKNLVC